MFSQASGLVSRESKRKKLATAPAETASTDATFDNTSKRLKSETKANASTPVIKTLTKEEFLAACSSDTKELSERIKKFAMDHAQADPNHFSFWLKYPVVKNPNLTLKIDVSRFAFKKYPLVEHGDYFSWMFKESHFLKMHNEKGKPYKRENYKIVITENVPDSTERSIVDMWVSHSGNFAEIKNIEAGNFTSGTDSMNIIDNYLDSLFQPHTMYLWDSSRCDKKPETEKGQVLYRVSRSIAYGMTWYMTRDFEPFDVENVASGWASDFAKPIKLNQIKNQYQAAVSYLQAFPLKNLQKIFIDAKDVEKEKILKDMMIKYKNLKTLGQLMKKMHDDAKSNDASIEKQAKEDLKEFFKCLEENNKSNDEFYKQLGVLFLTTCYKRERAQWKAKQSALASSIASVDTKSDTLSKKVSKKKINLANAIADVEELLKRLEKEQVLRQYIRSKTDEKLIEKLIMEFKSSNSSNKEIFELVDELDDDFEALFTDPDYSHLKDKYLEKRNEMFDNFVITVVKWKLAELREIESSLTAGQSSASLSSVSASASSLFASSSAPRNKPKKKAAESQFSTASTNNL